MEHNRNRSHLFAWTLLFFSVSLALIWHSNWCFVSAAFSPTICARIHFGERWKREIYRFGFWCFSLKRTNITGSNTHTAAAAAKEIKFDQLSSSKPNTSGYLYESECILCDVYTAISNNARWRKRKVAKISSIRMFSTFHQYYMVFRTSFNKHSCSLSRLLAFALLHIFLVIVSCGFLWLLWRPSSNNNIEKSPSDRVSPTSRNIMLINLPNIECNQKLWLIVSQKKKLRSNRTTFQQIECHHQWWFTTTTTAAAANKVFMFEISRFEKQKMGERSDFYETETIST